MIKIVLSDTITFEPDIDSLKSTFIVMIITTIISIISIKIVTYIDSILFNSDTGNTNIWITVVLVIMTIITFLHFSLIHHSFGGLRNK